MDWHVDREFVCYIDLKIPLQSSPSNSPPLTLQPFFNFYCCPLCMQSSLSRLHADKPCFATLIKLNCFMVVSSATVIETSARVGDFKLKSLSQIRVIFCNIHLPTKLFFKLYKVHLNIIYINILYNPPSNYPLRVRGSDYWGCPPKTSLQNA